jgi:uncharacterized protein
MIADQWCATSWRARPGSFVGLMTLYESNFVRLKWLIADINALERNNISQVASDCDLHLTLVERCRYTSILRLSYLFEPDGFEPEGFKPERFEPDGLNHVAVPVRDPDLEVCVYHDARLAEVRSFAQAGRHPHLQRLQTELKRELDQRWSRNMMLNKWLEYCAERGHRF